MSTCTQKFYEVKPKLNMAPDFPPAESKTGSFTPELLSVQKYLPDEISLTGLGWLNLTDI